MIKINSIKETCLYVKDLEACTQFYNGLLQLPVISSVARRHVFFRAGSSVLLCFIAENTLLQGELPPHGAQGIIHFALEVMPGNYDEALADIKALGIAISKEQDWPRGRRSFYFNDPDGHLVEIIQRGVWDQA
jgi:catechol 2,3-dioxygenase-like lactoylglutathione lyase family enzyme